MTGRRYELMRFQFDLCLKSSTLLKLTDYHLNAMQKLIELTKNILEGNETLPFSVYSSAKEQRILNVPVIKPLLIFVLAGYKQLGKDNDIICPVGNFVFLSNTPNIAMRNIPDDSEYFALLIEFEYADFDCLKDRQPVTKNYIQGTIDPTLELTLMQFVEWASSSPSEIWALRRQEILQVLWYQGFVEVGAIMEPPTVTHKVHTILSANIANDLGAEELSTMMAMSESTLRRKLGAEGSKLQGIKDRVKLGHGLHLIQTSFDPIGLIAEQCGYTSQSRFTEKFKQLFDVTPSELRKTRMRGLGE